MKKGVSIVMCCYNSSKLIAESLKHICRLKVSGEIPLELIIVDNNSTDDTSEKAQQLLIEYDCPVSYKILFQPVPGLSTARRIGISNSQYEYIIFCDDDNWLNEDYIVQSFKIMEGDKRIAALGGDNTAVSDGTFPEWFFYNQQSYAAGNQFEESSDNIHPPQVLWGAGLVLRKSALDGLFLKGFNFFLTDRTAGSLTSGGDTELCYALLLSGWKIRYDKNIKLKHFISSEKLNWKYLRKLNRGFGAQKADFDAYVKVFEDEAPSFNKKLENGWLAEFFKTAKKLRGFGFKKLLKFGKLNEGDPETLRIEKTLGKLNELLIKRSKYTDRINLVKKAPWRKVYSGENLTGEIYD